MEASHSRRALAVVGILVAATTVGALVATEWKALPWVPDAAVTGAADAPPASDAALPQLGTPQDVATGLAVPWGLAFLPDGTALVAERTTGQVLQVDAEGNTRSVGAVPGVAPDGEGGLLGLAVAPDFESDPWVYAYVTAASDNRIVVQRLLDGELRDSRPLLTGIPRASYHDGGRLVFGPDGMLYASTGDAGLPDLAQDRESLAGKILRVAPDGSVPDDNPFPDSPVWSYGHRNVQGLAFDDDGRLWASEFGSSAFDELNLIQPGANYGWPLVEGVGDRAGLVDPQVTWPTDEASPSGLTWVGRDGGGVLYMSALRGERLWQIPVAGATAFRPEAGLEDVLGRIRTVALAPDGQLWLTTSNTDGRGDPRPGDDRVVSVTLD